MPHTMVEVGQRDISWYIKLFCDLVVDDRLVALLDLIAYFDRMLTFSTCQAQYTIISNLKVHKRKLLLYRQHFETTQGCFQNFYTWQVKMQSFLRSKTFSNG